MRTSEVHEYLQAGISRRGFLRTAGVVATGAAAGPLLWTRTGRADVPPRGTHLAAGADPRASMVVSWETAGAVEGAVCDLGVDRGYGLTLPADTRTVAGTPTVYHHVALDRLEPDTRYVYRLRHTGGGTAEGTFRTAPARPAAPWRFTIMGDQNVGGEAAAETAAIFAADPALHVHVGDLSYAYSAGNGQTGSTNQSVWDSWFALNRQQAARAPWMVMTGNHEMEVGYGPQGYDGLYSRFSMPGNGVADAPLTWWTRWGDVGFVAMDGNDASNELSANRGWLGSAQEAWLRDALAALRADSTTDFIVVGIHNCLYTTNAVHPSEQEIRDRFGPLFDEFSVDLVVSGHNHAYERSYPLRAGRPTVTPTTRGAVVDAWRDGTTYLVAGAGGQVGYPSYLWPGSLTQVGNARVPETAEWSAVRQSGTSLVICDVDPLTGPPADRHAELRLRTVLAANGSPIDDLVLRRAAKAAASRRAPDRARRTG